MIRTVPSRRRQVWHQHKIVKKIADNHGNRLFKQSSKHVLSWTLSTLL